MLENMLLLNWWVATGTLFLEIALVAHIVAYLVFCFGSEEMKTNLLNNFLFFKKDNLEKYLLMSFFALSLGASILTLVYSEYFGQEPCALCWWQRVFMYGIVVLSGLSLVRPHLASPWKGEEQNKIVQKFQLRNILVFSILGLSFALYQHAEQMLALYGTHLPCPVSGADCAKMTLFEYGHITYPWMAVVLFGIFIIHILIQKQLPNN